MAHWQYGYRAMKRAGKGEKVRIGVRTEEGKEYILSSGPFSFRT